MGNSYYIGECNMNSVARLPTTGKDFWRYTLWSFYNMANICKYPQKIHQHLLLNVLYWVSLMKPKYGLCSTIKIAKIYMIFESSLSQVKACGLMAPSHYTWTNVDLPPVRFSDIHLWQISWKTSLPLIAKLVYKKYLTQFSFKSARGHWAKRRIWQSNIRYILQHFVCSHALLPFHEDTKVTLAAGSQSI